MQHDYSMGEGFSEVPLQSKKSGKKQTLLIIFLILFVIAIAIIGGLVYLGAQNKKEAAKITPVMPTPTTIITPSPTATQSASLTPPKTSITPSPTKIDKKAGSMDRSTLRIAILNGSGTPGAAKGTSSYLNGLGYTISTIGNADAFDYTGITIHVKKSKSNYLPQLQKDLIANPSGATVSAGIKDSIATDAEVIVGK